MVQLLWKTVWQSLNYLNIELLYDLAIPLLDTCPKVLKRGTQTDTCIPVFITALFTVDKERKQSECPAVEEWINKMWYIHIMEYTYNGILCSH